MNTRFPAQADLGRGVRVESGGGKAGEGAAVMVITFEQDGHCNGVPAWYVLLDGETIGDLWRNDSGRWRFDSSEYTSADLPDCRDARAAKAALLARFAAKLIKEQA